ncbi:DUF4097 family beta strand repeat-containing protein [Natranaerobius thermophilus]|uniref:DUF4097 domain-containing protein n=1 Tax=Natranaerobius thermophilus (strain ATCC BAA-1301 / DSM 18059 / JW/NM-WN-LF) TaxID=457570 RepID=B2A0X2_NATTJ|nr:DUF4097 family beta strand repeat-containing protein [Natranaerobius thermophilus]ACB86001.1 hypothetical protein Nther_2436 [Natranaerobius thermophilus JW/NM-WN-LF]
MLNSYSNNKNGEEFKKTVEKIDILKTIDISGINFLDIKTVSTYINFIPTSEKQAKVHFYGEYGSNYPDLQLAKKKDRLNLEIKRFPEAKVDSEKKDSLNLDIYIPNHYNNNIEVKTVSGNVNFGDKNQEVTDDKITEKLELSSMNNENIRIKSISGNIRVYRFNGDTDISTVSGTVFLHYFLFDHNIKVKTTSGNTNISLPENSSFLLRKESVSGNIRSDFPIYLRKNDRFITGEYGHGENSIDINTVSGTTKIARNK